MLVGAALVKSICCLPTWTRTARLIAEHAALREAIGGAPSQRACYRFATKLREHGDALANCIDRVLAKLHAAKPEMGKKVAIDGSDLPAYANGQRYVSRGGALRKKFSDPDATWGHRSSISTRSGGGYYGYKVHSAVCIVTGLPVAWKVETAKDPELPLVPVLLDTVERRGFAVDICVMDRGYDAKVIYDETEGRHIRPVVPLRKTPAVKAGKHKPPTCDHGEWTFAGVRRQAWREQMALPDRYLNPGVGVGQGKPAAHADSPQHRPVQGALPSARRGRARVRQAQARVGHAPAARPPDRPRQAAR